jgi:hypothetical protein
MERIQAWESMDVWLTVPSPMARSNVVNFSSLGPHVCVVLQIWRVWKRHGISRGQNSQHRRGLSHSLKRVLFPPITHLPNNFFSFLFSFLTLLIWEGNTTLSFPTRAWGSRCWTNPFVYFQNKVALVWDWTHARFDFVSIETPYHYTLEGSIKETCYLQGPK